MKKYWLTILIALMLLSLPLSAAARSGGPVTVQFPDTELTACRRRIRISSPTRYSPPPGI